MIKLHLNSTTKILKEHALDKNGAVQKFFTNECAKNMDKYIPFQNGALKNTKNVNENNIVYLMPYSRYQYYGKVMVGAAPKKVTDKSLTYFGNNRGDKWDERMWKAKGKEIINSTRKIIK